MRSLMNPHWMHFFGDPTGSQVRARHAVAWAVATLMVLTFAIPARAFGQWPAPAGVVKAESAQRILYITAKSPSEGRKAHCVLFGIASGAVLGAGVAYVYIHTGLAGPNEGSRVYKFFVPSGAAFGGVLGAVGRWPGPGGC